MTHFNRVSKKNTGHTYPTGGKVLVSAL